MKTKVFKRILSCILCVLVVFTLLPMSVLNASAATSEEVTKKRMNLVNYFNSMATVKWTAGQNFSMKIAGKMQTYYKGRVYYGFPYASGSKSFNLEDFNKELNRTGGYLNNTIGQSDCSTTMGVAYLKYVGGTQMWSVGCFCDSKYGFSKESDYSKLLPGDVLVRYGVSGSTNHVMMVVSVNKSAKTVTVTHQSSGFYKYDPSADTTGNKLYKNDTERNTSWGINQVKTFDGLKNSGYYGYVHKDLKMPLVGNWVTINYNGNGGSGATAPQTIAHGAKASLNGNGFTRSGYSFTGWYAKRNSDGKWYVSGKGWLTESEINSKKYTKKLYTDKSSLTFDNTWTNGAKGNIEFTFYAQWKQMPFSFNSSGAENITSSNAEIYATFNYQAIDSAGFYFGKSSSSLTKISKNLNGGTDGAGTFEKIYYPLNKWYGTLSPSTTYYYKLYVIKGGKEYTTQVKSFTTKAAASSSKISFTSVGVDSITETNANIYAKFDYQQIDSSGFYIGLSTSSLKKVSKNLDGKPDGAGKFNSINYPLNKWYGKLTPNTTYYYKLYVVKDGKECTTDVKSFTTKNATLTIKFNGNGGTISSDRFKLVSNMVYEGSSVLESKWVYDKPDPVYGLWNAESFGLYRMGHTFVGWGTTPSGGKIFDQDDTSVKPSDMSPNIKNGSCTITLYAIWKPITASFNYNANGGSGNTSAFNVTFGNGFTVSNSTVKRSGYKLVGWTVKRNGDNTWFANSAGWQTESAISQKGYKKKVYGNGSNWSFEESWVRKNVGSESYTFYAVWEKAEVKAPELDKKSISLKYKDSDTISVTNGVKVTWQSSNASVVSVDEYGNITAKKKGNATIIAISSDGSKAECNVSVRMEWWQTLLKIISFGIY